MKKIDELEKLRDDTTGDILRMLHDRVSAIEAKLEANTPQEGVVAKPFNKKDLERITGVKAKADEMLEPHTSDTPQEEDYSTMSDKELRELEQSCYSAPDGVDTSETIKAIYLEKKRRATEPHTSDTSLVEQVLVKYYGEKMPGMPKRVATEIIELLKEQDNGKRD